MGTTDLGFTGRVTRERDPVTGHVVSATPTGVAVNRITANNVGSCQVIRSPFSSVSAVNVSRRLVGPRALLYTASVYNSVVGPHYKFRHEGCARSWPIVHGCDRARLRACSDPL